MDIFKNYISKLPKNKSMITCPLADQALIKSNKKLNNTCSYIFYVEKVYCPPGIGWVITGILRCSEANGYLNQGNTCFIGPSNEQIQIKVWSIYNYYHEKIDRLYSGQRGCLGIRSDKKLVYKMFRKGTIITNNLDILKYATYKYKAIIKLLSHPSNVRNNFSPVIHCATIRQSAKITIIEIKNKKINTTPNNMDTYNIDADIKCICPGDTAVIYLEFKFNPEIIEPNESFFLREGLCLGVGTIIEPIY
jgi:GTPase